MIVNIISTCKYKLSEEEYVRPLVEIFRKIGEVEVIHYKDLKEEPRADLIVISGTAIKDFDYLNYLDNFSWLKNTNKKVIGICAGSQIITLIFGGKLVKKEFIGIYPIKFDDKVLKAYFLITKIPLLNEKFEILARIDNTNFPAIFKVKEKEIYGFTFHPEVLNEDLLLSFVKSL